MRILIFLLVLSICSICSAARVCLVKTTGELIEYQSQGESETMLQNAVNCGWELKNIEVREVTKAEWEAIKKKWTTDIAETEKAAQKVKVNMLKLKLKGLGFTDEELELLKFKGE